MNRLLIFFLVLNLLLSSSAFAIDTKYFSSYLYKQKAFWDSDFSLQPDFRFENNASQLYFYHVRTGLLFHPRPWYDLGFFYRLVEEKNPAGQWEPENRMEFVFSPRIEFPFNGQWMGTQEGGADGEEGLGWRAWRGARSLLQIIARNEFELRELDFADLSKVHVVYRVRPRMAWQYGPNTVYLQDEIFYSLKEGELFRNWATIGISRALNGISVGLFYTYETERVQFGADVWEQAHVLGTSLALSK